MNEEMETHGKEDRVTQGQVPGPGMASARGQMGWVPIRLGLDF